MLIYIWECFNKLEFMNKKYFWIGYVTGCFVFILTAGIALHSFTSQPDITLNQVMLENLAGEKEQLSNYLGKPFVVNYWATWCKPCIAEFPDFEELNKEQAGKYRLKYYITFCHLIYYGIYLIIFFL